jgi:transposase-like protein
MTFKQMIVELNQNGESTASLSREYGITESMIYSWKKQLETYGASRRFNDESCCTLNGSNNKLTSLKWKMKSKKGSGNIRQSTEFH